MKFEVSLVCQKCRKGPDFTNEYISRKLTSVECPNCGQKVPAEFAENLTLFMESLDRLQKFAVDEDGKIIFEVGLAIDGQPVKL